MSDEDSADEIDEDCKLLNGDVSEEGDLLPDGGSHSPEGPAHGANCGMEAAGTEGMGQLQE